ncbi:MAG: uroporphyrinogen-III synthase [Thermoanaerobaculales bacterium]|jgi:uroporphyrinogen-III synthase|nr:uroporphyrinogen-III synthase [Thermoanaerobaculales bacterium]
MNRPILVTREPADCADLQTMVDAAGLHVVPYPVFRLVDVDDTAGWDAVTRGGNRPDWVLMASPRAPERLVRRCRERSVDDLLDLPVAVVGEGTAEASSAAGLIPEIVGPGTGLGLAAELTASWSEPTTVLFACGHHRRSELPDALAAVGHRVLSVVLYRMQPVPKDELPTIADTPSAVVVTSPRATRLYLDGVGGRPLPCPHWALGPTTRNAAAEMGIECRIPPETNLRSLAEELCRTIP